MKSDKMKMLVQQVESIYLYSMLKLELMCELEEEDPSQTCLVSGYKVQFNENNQVPYYGL
jgi:hypothetical protein